MPVPGTQFVFAWTIIGGERVPVVNDRLVWSADDQTALCAVFDAILDARRAGTWTPPVQSESIGREEVVRGDEARWGPAPWSVIVFAPGSVNLTYYRESVEAHRRARRVRSSPGEKP